MIVPGGFSYGDYLRAGAIASLAPIMTEVRRRGPAAGCRCSASATVSRSSARPACCPGRWCATPGLHFVCRDQRLRVETAATAWTGGYAAGAEIVVPIKHAEGRYVADADTLARLEGDGRVVFRYAGDNPNGSLSDIAGISSADGRVVGLMPHPEHAVEALDRPDHRRARRCSARCCELAAAA